MSSQQILGIYMVSGDQWNNTLHLSGWMPTLVDIVNVMDIWLGKGILLKNVISLCSTFQTYSMISKSTCSEINDFIG